MYSETEFYKSKCHQDIAFFASEAVHYPLGGKLALNENDIALIEKLTMNSPLIRIEASEKLLQPLWRLAAIYQIHDLLFSKDKTIYLICESKHLARKMLETLYFPMNMSGESLQREIDVKMTGRLKLDNGMEIIAIAQDEIEKVNTKEALTFIYGLPNLVVNTSRLIYLPQPLDN